MDISDWLAIAGLCFTGAATPGASLAVVIKNTSLGGRRRGVATAMGHGIGVGIYAFGAVAGLTAAVSHLPSLFRFIEFAGAIFLFWMGSRVPTHSILHAGK